MAQLYVLLCGKSKSKLKPIMIDLKHKCENYQKARQASMSKGQHHYSITEADKNAQIWKKDTSNQWTEYNSIEPNFTKQPKTKRRRG